ncbi:unnamed protein product [Amoebophrya sp. A25]|nr:unnamed protein product [Amoebophrya sp. A25]|eukprot:GSA25T00007788001.1
MAPSLLSLSKKTSAASKVFSRAKEEAAEEKEAAGGSASGSENSASEESESGDRVAGREERKLFSYEDRIKSLDAGNNDDSDEDAAYDRDYHEMLKASQQALSAEVQAKSHDDYKRADAAGPRTSKGSRGTAPTASPGARSSGGDHEDAREGKREMLKQSQSFASTDDGSVNEGGPSSPTGRDVRGSPEHADPEDHDPTVPGYGLVRRAVAELRETLGKTNTAMANLLHTPKAERKMTKLEGMQLAQRVKKQLLQQFDYRVEHAEDMLLQDKIQLQTNAWRLGNDLDVQPITDRR